MYAYVFVQIYMLEGVCVRLKLLEACCEFCILIIDSLLDAPGRQGDPTVHPVKGEQSFQTDTHTHMCVGTCHTLMCVTTIRTGKKTTINRGNVPRCAVCHFHFHFHFGFQCSFPFRTLNVVPSLSYLLLLLLLLFSFDVCCWHFTLLLAINKVNSGIFFHAGYTKVVFTSPFPYPLHVCLLFLRQSL